MNTLVKFTPALVAVLMAAQPIAATAQNTYQSSQYGYGGSSQPSNQGSNADNYPDTPYDSTPTQRNVARDGNVPPPPPPPGADVYQQQPQYRNYADVQAQEQQGQAYQGQAYQGQSQGQPYQGQSAQTRPYDDQRNDDRNYAQGGQAYAQNPSQQNQNQPPAVDPNDHRYDGYCYERKDDAEASGTVIGAIAGALIGNGVSNRWNKGAGTVAGAIIGGAVGSAAGRSSVECYGGRYYSYDSGYYAPPAPPEGYTVVYYPQRPTVVYYDHIYRYGDVYGGYGGPRYYGRPYYGPPRGHYGYYRRW